MYQTLEGECLLRPVNGTCLRQVVECTFGGRALPKEAYILKSIGSRVPRVLDFKEKES